MGKSGGSSSSNSAADAQSALAADQWAFYQQMFLPEETALSKQAMAPVQVEPALNQVDAAMNQADKFRQETTGRELSRFGGAMPARLGASLEDKANLDMTRSRVNARNAVRRRAPELQQERLANVISMGQGSAAEASQGLGAAAGNAFAMQAAKNQSMNAMATGAGGLLGAYMAPQSMGGAGGNTAPGLGTQISNWNQNRKTARLGQQALSSDWGASLADPWSTV